MNPNQKKEIQPRQSISLPYTALDCSKVEDLPQSSNTTLCNQAFPSQTETVNEVKSSSTVNPTPQNQRSVIRCMVDAAVSISSSISAQFNTASDSLENSFSDHGSKLGNDADDENDDESGKKMRRKGRVPKRNKVLVAHNAKRYEKGSSSSEDEGVGGTQSSASRGCSPRLSLDSNVEMDCTKCLFAKVPAPAPAPAAADIRRPKSPRQRRRKPKSPLKCVAEGEITSPPSTSSDYFNFTSSEHGSSSPLQVQHFDRSKNARTNYSDRTEDAEKAYCDGTENAFKQCCDRTKDALKEHCDHTQNTMNDYFDSPEGGTKTSLAHEKSFSSKGQNVVENANGFYDEVCTGGHFRVKTQKFDSTVNDGYSNRRHGSGAMAAALPYITTTASVPSTPCITGRSISTRGRIPSVRDHSMAVDNFPFFESKAIARESIQFSVNKCNDGYEEQKQRFDSQDNVKMHSLSSNEHTETKPRRTVQFLDDSVKRSSVTGRTAQSKTSLPCGQRKKRKPIIKVGHVVKNTLHNPAVFGFSASVKNTVRYKHSENSRRNAPDSEQKSMATNRGQPPSHKRTEIHFRETALSRTSSMMNYQLKADRLQNNHSYRKLAGMHGSWSHLNESLKNRNIPYLHDFYMNRRESRCGGRKRLIGMRDLVNTVHTAKPPTVPAGTKTTFGPREPTFKPLRRPSVSRVTDLDNDDGLASPTPDVGAISSMCEANDLICNEKEKEALLPDVCHPQRLPPAPPCTKPTFGPLTPTIRLFKHQPVSKVVELDNDELASPTPNEGAVSSVHEANDLRCNEKKKEALLPNIRHPQKLPPPLSSKKIVTLPKVGTFARGFTPSANESAATKNQDFDLSSKKIALTPLPGLTESVKQLEELRRQATSGLVQSDTILEERVDTYCLPVSEPVLPKMQRSSRPIITCHITGKCTVTALNTQQVAIDITEVLSWNFTFDSDKKDKFATHPDSTPSSTREKGYPPGVKMDPDHTAVFHGKKLRGAVSTKSGESCAKYKRQSGSSSLYRDQESGHKCRETRLRSRCSRKNPSSFTAVCEEFALPADCSRSQESLLEKESICLLCAAEARTLSMSKGSCERRTDNDCQCISVHEHAAAQQCSALPDTSAEVGQCGGEPDLVESLNTDENCEKPEQKGARFPEQSTRTPLSLDEFYRCEDPGRIANSTSLLLPADPSSQMDGDGNVGASLKVLLDYAQDCDEHLDENKAELHTQKSSGDSVPKEAVSQAKVPTKCSHASFPPVRMKYSSLDGRADFVDRSDSLMQITLRIASDKEKLKTALTSCGGSKPMKEKMTELANSHLFRSCYKPRSTSRKSGRGSQTMGAVNSQGQAQKLPGKSKNHNSQGKINTTVKTPKKVIDWKEHILEDGVVWYEAVENITNPTTTETSDGSVTLEKSEDVRKPQEDETAQHSAYKNPDHSSKAVCDHNDNKPSEKGTNKPSEKGSNKPSAEKGNNKPSKTGDGTILRFIFSTKSQNLTTTALDSNRNAPAKMNVGTNNGSTAGGSNQHVSFPELQLINDVATDSFTDSVGDELAYKTMSTLHTATRFPVDQTSQLKGYEHELADVRRQTINKIGKLAPTKQPAEVTSHEYLRKVPYSHKMCTPSRYSFRTLTSFKGSMWERMFNYSEMWLSQYEENESQKHRGKDEGNANVNKDNKSEDGDGGNEGEEDEQNYKTVQEHQKQQQRDVLKDLEVLVTQLKENEQDDEKEKHYDVEGRGRSKQGNSEPPKRNLSHPDEAISDKILKTVETPSVASLKPKEQDCVERPTLAGNKGMGKIPNKVLRFLPIAPVQNVAAVRPIGRGIDPKTTDLPRVSPTVVWSWKYSLQPVRNFSKLDPRRVSSTSNIQEKISLSNAFLMKIPHEMLLKKTRSPRLKTQGGQEKRKERPRQLPKRDMTLVAPPLHTSWHGNQGKRKERPRRLSKRNMTLVTPPSHMHGNQRGEGLGSEAKHGNNIGDRPSFNKTCKHADTSAPRLIVWDQLGNSRDESGKQVLFQEAEQCSSNQLPADKSTPPIDLLDSKSSIGETNGEGSRITTPSEYWDSVEIETLLEGSGDSSGSVDLSNNCRHQLGTPPLSDGFDYVVDDFLPRGDKKVDTFQREIPTGHRARGPRVWLRFVDTDVWNIPKWQTVCNKELGQMSGRPKVCTTEHGQLHVSVTYGNVVYSERLERLTTVFYIVPVAEMCLNRTDLEGNLSQIGGVPLTPRMNSLVWHLVKSMKKTLHRAAKKAAASQSERRLNKETRRSLLGRS